MEETVLDSSGDLRLCTDTGAFVVSSKVMCLASPVWRAMFDPQGRWAKHASGVYQLPEDDANVLLILLRIAHLQFSELPDAIVDYQDLLQLAVLCDKYHTVQLVRPWLLQWQAPLQAQAEESCQKNGENYDGYETWLFIAWTFGDEAIFRKISRSLVLTSTITTVDGEERLVNAQGVVVGDTMPPGSVDAIIEARTERIEALLEMCYKLVDQYESTRVCTHGGEFSETCDSLVYGCLIKGLKSLELFPEHVKASEVEPSVMVFADMLRSLKCFTLPDGYHRDPYSGYRHDPYDHASCGFTHTFANQIGVIIGQKEPSGVLEEHLRHIGEQKKQK